MDLNNMVYQSFDCFLLTFANVADVMPTLNSMLYPSRDVEDFAISGSMMLIGFYTKKNIMELSTSLGNKLIRANGLVSNDVPKMLKVMLSDKMGCFISSGLGYVIGKMKITPMPTIYNPILSLANVDNMSATHIQHCTYHDFYNSAETAVTSPSFFQEIKPDLVQMGKTLMKSMARTTIQIAKELIRDAIA